MNLFILGMIAGGVLVWALMSLFIDIKHRFGNIVIKVDPEDNSEYLFLEINKNRSEFFRSKWVVLDIKRDDDSRDNQSL